MQLYKIFILDQPLDKEYVMIQEDNYNYLRNVLRVRPGDLIVVGDGIENEYLFEIREIHSNSIKAGKVDRLQNTSELGFRIRLYQSLCKNNKFEYIIQKVTELGVYRITPVITKNTVIKVGKKASIDNKLKRWNKIALEAARQCKRLRIPKVDPPLEYKELFYNINKSSLSLIPYVKAGQKLDEVLKDVTAPEEINIIIGPEGGFTEDEIKYAYRNNVKPVNLGPRILRAETAPLVLISVLLYVFGDIS